jgi:hypothetical protein
MGEVNLESWERDEIELINLDNKNLNEVNKEAFTKNLINIGWNDWKRWKKEHPHPSK